MQEIFNFAVLVTLSVPVLKRDVKLFREGKIQSLHDPDFFEPSVIYVVSDEIIKKLETDKVDKNKVEKLKKLKNRPLNSSEFKQNIIQAIGHDLFEKYRNGLKKQSNQYLDNIDNCARDYKQKLSSYLYFSTFAYFEGYVNEICKEIINSLEKIDYQSYIVSHSPGTDLYSYREKLNCRPDLRKKDRYKKFSNILKDSGYCEPEIILFSTLLNRLAENLDDLKANEIPTFLDKVFLFKFSEADLQTFHNIRNNRNSLAHGDNSFTSILKGRYLLK